MTVSRAVTTTDKQQQRVRKQKSRQRLKFFWRVHRTLGIFLAIGLLWLAITGLLMNHSKDMGLDRSYVNSPFILNWFDIQAPAATSSYVTTGVIVAELDGAWYWLDTRNTEEPTRAIKIAPRNGSLLGVVPQRSAAGIWYWLASTQQALLISPQGEVLESLNDWPPLATIQTMQANSAQLNAAKASAVVEQNVEVRQLGNLANADGHTAIVIELSNHSYWTSPDGLTWQQLPDGANVVWAQTIELDDVHQQALANEYLLEALSWETLLLKLHNGSALGGLGKWLLDIVGVGLCLLALSGIWLWFRTRRHR